MKNKKTISFIVLSLFLLNQFLLASPQSSEIPSVFLNITATRVKDDINEVPANVIVISSEEIEQSKATTLTELLNSNVDLYVRSQSGMGSVSSVSLAGSRSKDVLVLLDSIQLNSITSGDANLNQIPVDNIERIEIIKGGASNLYGENALAGVINIVTKSPKELIKDVTYSYGSFNTHIVKFMVSDKKGKLGYLVTANNVTTEGHRKYNNDYKGKSIYAKTSYDFSDDSILDLSFNYYDDDLGVPGAMPPVGTSPIGGNEYVTTLDSRNKNKRLLYNTGLKLPLLDGDISLKGYYRQEEIFNILNDKTSYYKDNTDIVGTSFIYDRYLTDTNRLSCGFDYNHNEADFLSIPGNSFWDAFYDDSAFWFQEKINVNSFIINFGARLDNNSKYDSIFNPNIGLIYKFSDNSLLRARASKAYGAPTINQLYYPLDPVWFYKGNESLTPEYSTNFELGANLTLLDNLDTGISFYKRETKDMISDSFNPMTFITMPGNINKNNVFGMDISLNLGIVDTDSTTLNYKINYNFIDAYDTDKKGTITSTYYIPKNKVYSSINFKGLNGINTSIKARYRSMITNGFKDLEEVVITDLFLSKTFESQNEIFLVLENIFDKEYSEQIGWSQTDRNYPMPGISMKLGTKLKF